MNYSDKVLEFATKAHEGQVRKYSGIPYITHPIEVAKRAIRIGEARLSGLVHSQLEIIKSISYLHDVLEDTNVSAGHLEKFLLSLEIPKHEVYIIFDSVVLLTKRKDNFDLFVYLDRIKNHIYALIVKLADNEHNSSDLKDKKKLDYYKLIRYYLQN